MKLIRAWMILDVDIGHDVPDLVETCCFVGAATSREAVCGAGAPLPTKLGAVWSALASRPPAPREDRVGLGPQNLYPKQVPLALWVKCVLLFHLKREGIDRSAPFR